MRAQSSDGRGDAKKVESMPAAIDVPRARAHRYVIAMSVSGPRSDVRVTVPGTS